MKNIQYKLTNTYQRIQHEKDRYCNSVFNSLHKCSSTRKGTEIEKLVSEFYEANHHTVEKSDSSDFDRKIDGKRVEIKGSFLWKGKNRFIFQQIRLHQEYDYILFIQFFPEQADIYKLEKNKLEEFIKTYDFQNQHGGNSRNNDEYWFHTTNLKQFPELEYIGSIEG